MNSFRKIAIAVASLLILWPAGSQPTEAQSPQPLYTNFRPAVKLDPLNFMQRLPDGKHAAFDIDLDKVPPAESVAEANSRFSARAAAAILYAASLSIADGATKLGEDYGTRILAKMAYADYFSGPDQVPERRDAPFDTLREEVNRSVEKQNVGSLLGSTIDTDSPISIHIPGEYDVLVTAYVTLYYKYYKFLDPNVQEKIFSTLLSNRGPYDPGEQFLLPFRVLNIDIPETENHRLMIQGSKYLTNQLYYQKSVSDGRPDHSNFDNNRNGNGGSNPPMVNVILGMLEGYLTRDFVEYNARPYQDYTMTALMNLATYAYDDRVRLAARMVLDYVSAKVAVSSEDLRRSTPFRRRNEDATYGPTGVDGFLRSPLVFNFGSVPGKSPPGPYEPDPQGAFCAMLAGNTGVLGAVPPLRRAPGNYAFEMVHAALSDYRLPPAILDLFVSNLSRTFYQGFHHYAGINQMAKVPGQPLSWYANELYAGSPSYLISAGGNPSYYAYTADILGLSHPGDPKDLGVALPTTFIPSWDSASPTFAFGTFLTDIIQFGKTSTDHDTVHLGVAPDFACGGPIYVPEALEPTNPANRGDPTLVRDRNWTFVDRGGDGTKPGYYLAIYRVSNLSLTEQWGFLEAYDTWLNRFRGPFFSLSFGDFQRAVKRANSLIGLFGLQFGNDEVNTYVTQSRQHIQFTLAPHSTIISTTAEPDHSIYTNTFAHGSVINDNKFFGPNDDSGSGLITISNPAVGTPIILDMRDFPAAGDGHFGMHHPARTTESGEVERTGSNNEVWVDSKYPGGATGGDFGDPFHTLAAAIDAVAVDGTINIINVKGPENGPRVITKRMTIKAVPGPVRLVP